MLFGKESQLRMQVGSTHKMEKNKVNGKKLLINSRTVQNRMKLEFTRIIREQGYGNFVLQIKKFVMDHIMGKVQNSVDGQNQVKILIVIVKLFMRVSMIIIKKLADGIFFIDQMSRISLRLCIFYLFQLLIIKSGGGLYNENGLKFGNWIELIPFYGDFKQVIQCGNYKNDKKIGKWDIKYQKKGKQSFSIIGGGSYDEQGLKSGIWVELNDNFGDYAEILFVGQYQKNVKIGRWDIYQGTKIKNTSNKIGGGLYDKQGQKYGLWEEISNNFFNKALWLIQKQQEIWQMVFYNEKSIDVFILYHYKNSGGGYYNEQGLKVGFWEDVSDIFQNYCQITYKGEYYDGKKVGSWDLIYFKKKIGGGYYNDQGLKNGKWIELGDNFKDNVQELENAEYKNGWNIGLQCERINKERIAGFLDQFSFRFVRVYIQTQQ
ncbi:unnamed protein product [Paramecium sonneborni]|uniref:Uncharacterized protein n=1 Tax=Paramecium sonneborni TaxID=65129 RepID=A0A8S1RPE9_9CILI|nr:unnamed protein product [Paramecium sonneborni]